MPFDYESQYEFLPIIGKTKEFSIKKVERIEAPLSSQNFKSKEKNYGYHYLIHLDSGKTLIMNNFGLYKEFKEANIQEGDCVVVEHVGQGEWRVEKK